jgi:hypothetical protein
MTVLTSSYRMPSLIQGGTQAKPRPSLRLHHLEFGIPSMKRWWAIKMIGEATFN